MEKILNYIIRCKKENDKIFSLMLNGDGFKETSQRFRAKNNFEIARKHRPDYYIVLAMALLMMLGMVLIYAIGPQRAIMLNRAFDSNNYSEIHFFKRQFISIIIAIGGFIIAAIFPHQEIRKKSLIFLRFSIFLAVFLLISRFLPVSIRQHFTICALGACRWLKLGSISIQVSEVMKIAMIIFLATFWDFLKKNDRINSRINFRISVPIILLVLIFIIVAQKDFGTGFSLTIIIFFMAWMSNLNLKPIIISIISLGIISTLAILTQPHRISRMISFMGGDSESNYHANQAKIALGTGGMTGLGVGNSVQSTGYLPEAINDSIFAIIGEMFGFIGVILVIALFMFLVYRLLTNMVLSQNYYNKLIISGTIGWFFGHFIINTFSMIVLAPITGITLPFLSYGGTSMLFIAIALGLSFNASRYTSHSLNQNRRRKKR